ncbi:hypothetical protein C0992_009713 [Termitomyces sp. T32_za158]|nr:hypothetical protein C0992_009713 [Termitomyces sp. T32_za158]
MPGMNEAVKIHMDHMHDCLNCLVDDSLGVRFKFPDGVRPCQAEGKHIRAYAGGHKFSQLEDWAMDVCYHLAACCYGGHNMDQERIFVLHEFMDGEAWNWFCRHVLHTNRDKSYWTFKEVLIGLYNRFVNAATMQEAHEAFRMAVYNARTGIQTFYNDLVSHAQNMAVYLDEFTIWETFLDGIPAEMHCALIGNDNLSPEVNTVTKFLALNASSEAEDRRHWGAHLRALREQFKPKVQLHQKCIEKGKAKPTGLPEEDIPRLCQQWQQEFMDIVNGMKPELLPWREVNHEINLIDKTKQYKYHLPCCPRALQEQFHNKTNCYINAKWWEPWLAKQAAPLLCIPKKDGTLRTALDA